MESTRFVNKGIVKKDAQALLSGRPVYTADLAPADCLIVKVLRSPHANAMIKDIKIDTAKKVPGIEAVYTYKDVPDKRFTLAGQTFPEPSPDDRLILDQHVRFVGDPVAIVAGENPACVDKALKMIKVTYEVLESLLDFRASRDNKIIIHPEDNYGAKNGQGTDPKRNLCASQCRGVGDVDVEFEKCKYKVEETYHIKAVNQTMMENFTAFTSMDVYGRLKVVSATQIPFHVRRIMARALDIPKSKVRVVKPRIGGGFGAKQTAVMEMYPAFVTYRTGRPAMMEFTREESFINGSPRHEMEMKVRLGANEEGEIKVIDLYTTSNTGAYGEHGPTTVDLSGTKSISLYRNLSAWRFKSEVVYTNTLSAGAYRGYGATQGLFAIQSAINELAHKMDLDPMIIQEKNIVHEGDVLANYYGETTGACALDRCIARVKEMIDWENKYPCVKVDDHTVRSVGMAIAMQGSGIGNCDVGSVTIKMNDDGFYTMLIGCSDMGTGCDTILAQMAADCLGCEFDEIVIHGVDTDQSPYDSGSYASSTTYVTGMAVVRACEEMKKRICKEGADILGVDIKKVEFDGAEIREIENPDHFVTLESLSNMLQAGRGNFLEVTVSNTSPCSPPPYMCGAAEIEVDLETGKITPLHYYAAVDCGTVINTNLARIQTEGGLVQGLGMTLYEDIQYTQKGKLKNRNFINYKIPTRLDMGEIHVAFESSYEPTGPFGAKSIGEIVINTPAPAIADAVYNATGLRFRELPITAQKVFEGLNQ